MPLPFYQRQQLDEKLGLGLFTDNYVQEIDMTTPGEYTINLAPFEKNIGRNSPHGHRDRRYNREFSFQYGPFLTFDYANEEGRLHLH